MKEHLSTTKPGTFIVVSVYYDKGGMNYFTGNNERRAYYASATPVEIANGFESFKAFSGNKLVVLEVKRKSGAAEAKAIEMSMGLLYKLVKHVEAKNSLTITDDGWKKLRDKGATLEIQK